MRRQALARSFKEFHYPQPVTFSDQTATSLFPQWSTAGPYGSVRRVRTKLTGDARRPAFSPSPLSKVVGVRPENGPITTTLDVLALGAMQPPNPPVLCWPPQSFLDRQPAGSNKVRPPPTKTTLTLGFTKVGGEEKNAFHQSQGHLVFCVWAFGGWSMWSFCCKRFFFFFFFVGDQRNQCSYSCLSLSAIAGEGGFCLSQR